MAYDEHDKKQIEKMFQEAVAKEKREARAETVATVALGTLIGLFVWSKINPG